MPLQTVVRYGVESAGQVWICFEHWLIWQLEPGSQRTRQTPEPGHRTVQLPTHVTSHPPEPVQSTLLAGPTATRQGPEPVHAVLHPPGHEKSHAPEPAHCRSQLSRHSTRQSPDDGQTHAAPLHSKSPDEPSPHATSPTARNTAARTLFLSSSTNFGLLGINLVCFDEVGFDFFRVDDIGDDVRLPQLLHVVSLFPRLVIGAKDAADAA